MLVPKGSMIDAVMQLREHLRHIHRRPATILSATKMRFRTNGPEPLSVPVYGSGVNTTAIVAFADALYAEKHVNFMLQRLGIANTVFWVCETMPQASLAAEMELFMDLHGPAVSPHWSFSIPDCPFKIEHKWTKEMVNCAPCISDSDTWANAVIQNEDLSDRVGQRRIKDAFGNSYHVVVGTRCLLVEIRDTYVSRCAFMPYAVACCVYMCIYITIH